MIKRIDLDKRLKQAVLDAAEERRKIQNGGQA